VSPLKKKRKDKVHKTSNQIPNVQSNLLKRWIWVLAPELHILAVTTSWS